MSKKIQDDAMLTKLEAANNWFKSQVESGAIKERGNTQAPLETKFRPAHWLNKKD